MKFSIIINADTRIGNESECNTVGDFGTGSLQGCRSTDFLIDSVKAVHKFFQGYDFEILVCIDRHEPIPDEIVKQIKHLENYGNIGFRYCSAYRQEPKWNDFLYTSCLRLHNPEAEYVVHIDQDCAIFRDLQSDIIECWMKWLEEYKYVCQPHNGGDPMWHASTRFFVCKRETLDLDEIEQCLDDEYRIRNYGDKHCPALEHILGLLAGGGKVLYPDPQNEQYLIVNWVRYHKGTMKKLNEMRYDLVRGYFDMCGIHGANDVLGMPIYPDVSVY